jgi:hypothetical protein
MSLILNTPMLKVPILNATNDQYLPKMKEILLYDQCILKCEQYLIKMLVRWGSTNL